MNLPLQPVRIVTASGTVHVAYEDAEHGIIFSAEGDNLDDADRTIVRPIVERDGSLAFHYPPHADKNCERCLG